MNLPLELLVSECRSFGLELGERQKQQLEAYAELLIDWNSRMNLTAICQPEEIVVKHFLDSLLLLKHIDLPGGAAVIDVGTGAGFPGMVLKIARPDLELTLLDSLKKRISFLEELGRNLELPVVAVHGRAEELGRRPEYRERYDLATARAVARLAVLGEYCLPFVKPGGRFISMKGPDVSAEIAESVAALRLLGGSNPVVFSESLPDGSGRSFVHIKKISQTPAKYPRASAKITKQPLK